MPGRRQRTTVVTKMDNDPITRDTLPNILQPMLREAMKEALLPLMNDLLQPMLRGMEEKLMGKIDDIGKEMRPAIAKLQTSVAEQAENIQNFSFSVSHMDKKVTTLEKKYDDLMEKVVMLEDRARRNNLKIFNLPESCEAQNPVKFIQTFLQKTFPQEFTTLPPEIDRAHRIGPLRFSNKRPRPFIVRIHFFRVKERIVQLAKEAGQLKYDGKNIYIYPDWSVETSKKHLPMVQSRISSNLQRV